jgi:hypothetical protein
VRPLSRKGGAHRRTRRSLNNQPTSPASGARRTSALCLPKFRGSAIGCDTGWRVSNDGEPSPGNGEFSLAGLLRSVLAWADRNRETIAGFLIWGAVERACERTRLYAPADLDAWKRITEAESEGTPPLEALILNLYGPGGVAHETLVEELTRAPLLASRRREVDEVLASLDDGRYYVTICGALPLVEGVLATAYGKWQKRVDDYPLTDRLDTHGDLTPDEEAELVLNVSAIHMLDSALPEVWRSGAHRVGAIVVELRRHLALHGTASGWDTRENAVRSVLLLAAAARVSEPLLAPR